MSDIIVKPTKRNIWDAIVSVYERHDVTEPLSSVLVGEFVEAVMEVINY